MLMLYFLPWTAHVWCESFVVYIQFRVATELSLGDNFTCSTSTRTLQIKLKLVITCVSCINSFVLATLLACFFKVYMRCIYPVSSCVSYINRFVLAMLLACLLKFTCAVFPSQHVCVLYQQFCSSYASCMFIKVFMRCIYPVSTCVSCISSFVLAMLLACLLKFTCAVSTQSARVCPISTCLF